MNCTTWWARALRSPNKAHVSVTRLDCVKVDRPEENQPCGPMNILIVRPLELLRTLDRSCVPTRPFLLRAFLCACTLTAKQAFFSPTRASVTWLSKCGNYAYTEILYKLGLNAVSLQ